MKTEVYSVWCGGVEINDYYLTKLKAKTLMKNYIDKGYVDVNIRKEVV